MSQGITTKIRHLGKLVTFRTLCRRFNLPYYVLWRRYKRGDRGARLVRPVETKYGHRGRWSGLDEDQPAHS
jgi:hypothetical protein